MATPLRSAEPGPLDGMSLPGWLYFDPEFFEAEKKAFLRAAPQVVCHDSEIGSPASGAASTISARAYRHPRRRRRSARILQRLPASRLAAGGRHRRLRQVLTCPYHAWSYGRDGRLVGVPHRHEYPDLQTEKLGCIPSRSRIGAGSCSSRSSPARRRSPR